MEDKNKIQEVIDEAVAWVKLCSFAYFDDENADDHASVASQVLRDNLEARFIREKTE
jgi:hypothetical protein